MDESLEVKTNARLQVELLVALELSKMSGEIADAVSNCLQTGVYIAPDSRKLARKIIAIVKEHSV